MSKFAINYVLGYYTKTIVVDANDSDDAYAMARYTLRKRGLISVSLQGSCRPATDLDILRHEMGSTF